MNDTDIIREAIQDILADAGDDNFLVGDIIVLAELTGIEGPFLFTLMSPEMTVWKQRGMLGDRIADLDAQALQNREDYDED